jgi:hypothetical protein
MGDWDRIDELILTGRTILAIKEIRDRTGCSLQEGVDRYHARAALLRETAEPEPRR